MMEQINELISVSTDKKIDYNKQWNYYRNSNTLYLQMDNKRYKLRNFYNFVTKTVNTDVALLMKGMKIVGDDVRYTEILNAIYKSFRKDLFARFLAVYGNSYIKMEIDEEKQLINLKVLQSQNTDFTKDADGNMLQVTYSYLQKDIKGNTASIKEVYTSTVIQKYVDDELIEEKENKYGFIPIYHFMFQDMGEKFGANTFDEIIDQQDSMNSFTNVINHVGLMLMNPYLHIGTGDSFTDKQVAQMAGQYAKNIMDGLKIVVTTSNGKVDVVGGGLENVEDGLAFLDRIQSQIEQTLPELLLGKIADKNLSGKAIATILTDLINKITCARENIQRGLNMVNSDIYKVLVRWGKIPATTENFTEIKFAEVIDFSRADVIEEVRQELEMGLITEDMARQMLGIEWSGMENKTETKETTPNGETSNTTSPKTIDKTANKKGFVRKIADKVQSIFGADK